MNNYVILALGWILGQAAYLCVKSWDIQKKNESVDFKHALSLLFSKETAAWFFGFVMLLIIMFVLSDFIDLNITKEDVKNMEVAKWKVYLINFQRTVAVVFGFVCQRFGYAFFGRTEKILKDRAEKEGVKIPD